MGFFMYNISFQTWGYYFGISGFWRQAALLRACWQKLQSCQTPSLGEKKNCAPRWHHMTPKPRKATQGVYLWNVSTQGDSMPCWFKSVGQTIGYLILWFGEPLPSASGDQRFNHQPYAAFGPSQNPSASLRPKLIVGLKYRCIFTFC